MTSKADQVILDWLFENAGPIIRWRLVKDFAYPVSKANARELQQEIIALPLVTRWLNNLGHGGLHGSKDTDAENAMAKLVEFGLHAGIPQVDEKMLPYAEQIGQWKPDWQSDIINAFLIGAGYTKHPSVKKLFLQRLDILYELTRDVGQNLFLSPEEAENVPKAWKGRKIYRINFASDGSIMLPSCYDFYGLAHWPYTPATKKKAETVVKFISHPDFQSTGDGCLWDRKKNQCYSAGSTWLACCEPKRKVIFTELGARFSASRKSSWFKQVFADLESYKTDSGTYCFPADYLTEKPTYYMYQGAHMGLGENRRKKSWCEIESTFRMMNIKRIMTLK